jgi:predicted phosphodiesterase
MERFRLLHLSDLHIGESSFYAERGENRIRQVKRGLRDLFFRPASLPRLSAVARFAFRERNRIEALLISGDLASCGTARALQAALEFVDAPAADLWQSAVRIPTLRSASRPIHLLPGNHDRFDDVGGAGGRLFDRVFMDYWTAGQGCGQVELKRASGESLFLAFCDLTLVPDDASSFVTAWGQGKAYSDRVGDLVSCTARIRALRPLAGIVWVVHFAPGFAGISSLLRLLDEEDLIRAAEKAGINYILCGHTHEYRLYSLGAEKAVAVLCAGSAAQRCERPNSLHAIELEVSAGAVTKFDHQAVFFDPVEGCFPSLPDAV